VNGKKSGLARGQGNFGSAQGTTRSAESKPQYWGTHTGLRIAGVFPEQPPLCGGASIAAHRDSTYFCGKPNRPCSTNSRLSMMEQNCSRGLELSHDLILNRYPQSVLPAKSE